MSGIYLAAACPRLPNAEAALPRTSEGTFSSLRMLAAFSAISSGFLSTIFKSCGLYSANLAKAYPFTLG